MPVKDLTQFTDDALTRELVITEDETVRDYIVRLLRDRAAERAAAQPEISRLTDAEIVELLPFVTDQPTRDALVRVLWARAARQARAGHAATRTPG